MHGQLIASALLHFVLEYEYIDKVVIGVQRVQQLQNILHSLENAPNLRKTNQKINHKILQPSLWPV
jgi:predicted aldo/keto reductase-like oxidoreductase